MTQDVYKGIDGERVKLEGDELSTYLANETAAAKKEQDEAKAEADKAAKKAAAEAKLAALGLTADDLQALGLI
jgi:membrane protein involved in colicin uptake